LSPDASDTGATFEVDFHRQGRPGKVRAGSTVMDASAVAGVWMDAPCGGEGRCGKCRIRARGALGPPTPAERKLLGDDAIAEGSRLACQAEVAGPCTVELQPALSWSGAKSSLSSAGSLVVDLASLQAAHRSPVGAALDIGTTTLSVSLVDLLDGRRLGIASGENPQTRFGADVMTRIEKCRRDGANVAAMHDAAISTFNDLLERLLAEAARGAADLVRLVMVGNTTMLHLAMGEDPSSLGTFPFEPVLRGPVESSHAAIGLAASPDALLLVPRVLSGFLGGDIVGVMLASGMALRRETCLVVDLGTNGEIALGSRDGVAACSTAAGPAFEGAQVSHGMRAVPGAIESMSRDGLLTPRVLGGGEPRGICGSGLLDAAAALLESGLLAASGRLVEPVVADGSAPGRVRERRGMREFVLAPGTDLALTQQDIRQLQLAKGAIGAGIRVLCSRLGISPGRIDRVYLAGVFGSFLKPSSAVTVGIFPTEVEGRIEFAGNAALIGAEMMLSSDAAWQSALELAGKVKVLELSEDREFEKAFIDNLSFPAQSGV
jgi:uncharacterized 2Fe-2S/4Fe-4S cluster protein (DUF4445 family)